MVNEEAYNQVASTQHSLGNPTSHLGYLPDGTPMNRAGNAINHPETIGPDPHTPGSPLPRAIFTNSVGYLPDGTPMNAAGNALNHPETMQPDAHAPGSPLPASYYAAEVGFLAESLGHRCLHTEPHMHKQSQASMILYSIII